MRAPVSGPASRDHGGEAELSFYGLFMGFAPPGVPPVRLAGG
jgi:hypothetical protein